MSAPFNLAQSFNEALALQRQGRLRDAEKIYTRVLKGAPDHFDALNLLGTVKAQLGRMGEAHRLLSAAVKINPRVAGAWANLGQVLLALKRSDDALECLDKARALDRDNVAILNQHANALLNAGRTEAALAGEGDLEEALASVLPMLEGAFSFVLLDADRLIGVRDPNGFRPLCLGRLDATEELEEGGVLASEAPGLDVLGAKNIFCKTA